MICDGDVIEAICIVRVITRPLSSALTESVEYSSGLSRLKWIPSPEKTVRTLCGTGSADWAGGNVNVMSNTAVKETSNDRRMRLMGSGRVT